MKIAIAMSGGLDSSIVAARLQEQGAELFGITLRLFDEADTESAARISAHLGIPHQVLDLRQEFRSQVINTFAREYMAGRTPNPCAHCNPLIKFGLLLEAVRAQGAEKMATGHYVRLQEGRLLKAVDPSKDQSYFLFGLEQRQIKHLLFPLGESYKAKLREEARERGLPNWDRADSEDICFVPEGEYSQVVEEISEASAWRPGPILDAQDRELGRHKGIHRFTIGQRKGLGISTGVRSYVTEIDAQSGTLRLGPREALKRSRVWAKGCRWIKDLPEGQLNAKIRYRHQGAMAEVESLSEEDVQIRFYEPQYAVTPGQALVLYRGDELLGGGWIEDSE